jgi:hypothetical protein
MSFFSNLFIKPKNDESSILNAGLDMAMEFGENFRQPIQERLSKKFRSLSPEQLNHYNTVCLMAMKEGNDFLTDLLSHLSSSHQTIREADLKHQLISFMKTRYSWINQNNLDRLYSQGCYYAFKNGDDSAIRS